MQFKQNELLKNHTTFKIGGLADWFVVVQSKEELKTAVNWAKAKSLPFFILGAGSNVLVSDKGFQGLIIKNKAAGIKINQNQVIVQSGTPTSQLVKAVIDQDLAGLEVFFGLPGTIGGAVAVNAHSQEQKIRDFVEKVERFDGVILSVIFRLESGDKKSLLKKAKKTIQYRQKNQPLEYPSAGCIFQNPNSKQSAGSLIDQCGLKGTKIGGAMISEKHANFIINISKAESKDVLALIDLARKKVKEKFKIGLELEIIKLGEF